MPRTPNSAARRALPLAALACCLLAGTACGPAPLLPTGWDPKIAADQALAGLVRVTAPQVRGAHDAAMVLVDRRAFIVAEVSDEQSGESAKRPEIYCSLSIVNLDSLAVEEIVPIARGGQSFEGASLPEGACFVPRIIRRNEQTLRTYFASEQPGKRQSQIWYRDFDLRTNAFASTVHKAAIKTSAGTFDMQPRRLHADAAQFGFTEQPEDYGMYIFDSFKIFHGEIYVTLNNYPGKQNALAKLHDDFSTFEVVSHYNEPQSAELSESSVNRLPDGSWMAICRSDFGNRNYHFTTSQDGVDWSAAREFPIVSNGWNSKPTFDKFGDVYYLGWQDAARVDDVNRSVFNVDVSRDGKNWVRKYRFETDRSFQYPTFVLHDGVIWLSVTQGDSSPSRKERIMFGKLDKRK